MLYNFHKLAQKLTQLGFREANATAFRVIKRDLTVEERAGNVDFKQDGVYLHLDSQEYRGYMYLKSKVQIATYGLPKFHITNCSKIQDERQANNFTGRYFWHNSNVVSIEDKTTGEILENQVLTLCSYCKHEAGINNCNDTTQFHGLLDQQEIEDTTREIQLDIFGRPSDWDAISKEYRHEKNYTCENCNFGGSMLKSKSDQMFIHTDHIVAWELANMRRNNLQCLCILCHSQKDEVHKANFLKPGMQSRLKRFVEKYRTELRALDNKFVDTIG